MYVDADDENDYEEVVEEILDFLEEHKNDVFPHVLGVRDMDASFCTAGISSVSTSFGPDQCCKETSWTNDSLRKGQKAYPAQAIKKKRGCTCNVI